jgi:hypothetical protein
MSWRYLRIWLPLWYLQDIMLSVLLWCTDLITPLVSSRHYVVCSSSIYGFDYSLGIGVIKSVFQRRTDNIMSWRYQRGNQIRISKIRILITPSYLQDIMLSVLVWCTDSGYPYGIFKTYVICSSSIYGLWLLLISVLMFIRVVWRYQRCNQNP